MSFSIMYIPELSHTNNLLFATIETIFVQAIGITGWIYNISIGSPKTINMSLCPRWICHHNISKWSTPAINACKDAIVAIKHVSHSLDISTTITSFDTYIILPVLHIAFCANLASLLYWPRRSYTRCNISELVYCQVWAKGGYWDGQSYLTVG